jgi:type IV fimbrial biogenesis protein FimT
MIRSQHGLSLLEVLVALFIVSILAAIGLPNFSKIIAKQRLDNKLSQVVKQLNFSRIYAINNDTYVTTCPLNGASCSTNWQLPIYTFIDNNANLVLDEDDLILYFLDAVKEGDEFTYPRKGITYRPNGSIKGFQSGSFVYCVPQYPDFTANRVSVSQPGRIRKRDTEKCEDPSA